MYEFAVTPAVTQLRRPGVLITEVAEGSVGHELELIPGDRITRVNGRQVRDYLDFRFQTAGETELTFRVKKASGETIDLEFDRHEGEDLGLMFEQIVPRQCANECLFCFCKGNPDDARPSLFVRDEDIRLSFLYGNYTTLTSITDSEMERIIEQRLSPQYVSIHATDLATRAYLLGVPEKRADISGKLEKMLDNDIEIHAQIVLCPEINDGAILEKTLRDLAAFYPKVISVAIVPVALTRYNTDERLTRVTPEFALRTIREVGKLQREFRSTLGKTFAYLGDELYVKAGLEVPSRRHYGNYPQIEDGVGMIRSFLDSFGRLLKKGANSWRTGLDVRTRAEAMRPAERAAASFRPGQDLFGSIITGEMFAPILRHKIGQFNEFYGTRLTVLATPNTYFGGDVAVAGLLSGRDVLNVQDKIAGDFLVIPKHIIKSDEPVLIDGMAYVDLTAKLPVPVLDLDMPAFLRLLSRSASAA